jgi:hypothetical protein
MAEHVMRTLNELRKSADVSDKRMASLPQHSAHYLATCPDLRPALHSSQELSDMVVYLNETRSAQRKRGSGKICQEMDGESRDPVSSISTPAGTRSLYHI